MTHQDTACAAFVVMSSLAEESSSTSGVLSTERPNGLALGSVDRVSVDTVDVGPTDVTENSILAGLGLIDVWKGGLGAGIGGTSAGEPRTLSLDPNGGSVQTEFKLVGGLGGQELAAPLAMG